MGGGLTKHDQPQSTTTPAEPAKKADDKSQGQTLPLPKEQRQLRSAPHPIKPSDKDDARGQSQTLSKEERQLKSPQDAGAGSVATPRSIKPINKADYQRRLQQLCRQGCKADISQFRQIIRQGVDVNIYDEDGKHPLWYASYYGQEDIILLLLEYKAIVDLPTNDKFGDTALIAASQEGQIKCATVLLKHRANVNYQRKHQDSTPLILACAYGHLKLAVLLIQHGAMIDYVNKDGVTGLNLACRGGHTDVVTLLLDKGANINKGRLSPLYSASFEGYLHIVQMLVSRGARIDQPTDDDYAATPLLMACDGNHVNVASYLVEKGANINYQNKKYGQSALHAACEKGHLIVAKLLIESQANLEVEDNDGETPFDLARQNGHSEIVSLLERADHTSSSDKEGSSRDDETAEGAKSSDIGSEEGAAEPKTENTNEESPIVEMPREREASSYSTAPSGHILTKTELQVLRSLLATYSNEKLKEIQLSIGEKEAIHNITREEVERSLQQRGLEAIASGLKDNIEKGVENLKHYKAYEEALKGGLTLTLRYLKFLFFGPPRSGKSSTRRRLIKEIVNLSQHSGPSISTGVAETNDVIIKKLTSEPAAIAGSQWWSMKRSKESTQLDMYGEGELGYLAQLFYRLIYKSATPASSSELFPVQESDEHSKNETLDPSVLTTISASTKDEKAERKGEKAELEMLRSGISDAEETEINVAFDKLTSILQSDSPEDLKRLLEDLTMINMTDVGGQPAFLDMLPALTIGPALYFLFFRLDQELRKQCPVRFLPEEKGAEIVLETSYCIEEVLYQCLASIACFSSHSQENSIAASKSAVSSRALLFGTYKDQVDEAQISSVQKTLEDRFKGTKLYKEGLLLKPLKSKMAFTVDNMHGTEESEMSDIRNDIERIITTCFPAIPIPVSWLMFRVVLHLLNKPVIGFAQCEEIAKRLLMPTSVKEAIWFFHHNIGSLMHYSNIPSMEDTVICDPQIIFDSISKLIIDKFQYANRAMTAGEIEEFHQRGLFTLSHIQETTEHPQGSVLKLNQLLDLLKHVNVLAEIKQEDTQSEPKFIMPAVMKYALEDELVSTLSTSVTRMSPIIIHFESGVVPFGVFCACISHLIAQLDSMSPRWQLCDDQVMRNKIKFLIDGTFFATLISRPQYIMIHVERHQRARYKSTLEVICSKVRKAVVETLETIISNMKYKPYGTLQVSSMQPFELAFTCNLEDSHSDHFMTVTKDDSGHHAKCLKSHINFDLEDRHLIWFKDKHGRSDSTSSTSTTTEKCSHDQDDYGHDIYEGSNLEPPPPSSNPTAQKSESFHYAEESAEIPFLVHQVLECDHRGLTHTVSDHDITLRIRKGSVCEGETIHFEIGVTMYGPFSFPDNTQPISPIIWLCLLEEGYELQKEFEIYVPHFLMHLTEQRIQHHQVCFAKAYHNYCMEMKDKCYTFHQFGSQPSLIFKNEKCYAVLTSKHCCFLCLSAPNTHELALVTEYCMVRIEPSPNEVCFLATFLLETCLQIKASDIDFWNCKQKSMEFKHKMKMYPPRMKVTVDMSNSTLHKFKLPIKFEGSLNEDLDTELIFPLQSSISSVIHRRSFSSQSIIIPDIDSSPIDDEPFSNSSESACSHSTMKKDSVTPSSVSNPVVRPPVAPIIGIKSSDLVQENLESGPQDNRPLTSSVTPHQIDATPSLAMLSVLKTCKGKKIHIIKRMAPSWYRLGVFMDFDNTGTQLEIIKKQHSMDLEACCLAVFQHWVKGNGVKPCSWHKLIELIDDCGEEVLAKEIQSALSQSAV